MSPFTPNFSVLKLNRKTNGREAVFALGRDWVLCSFVSFLPEVNHREIYCRLLCQLTDTYALFHKEL